MAPQASIARVYGYWLGGTGNYEPDRDTARRVAALLPEGTPERMARNNRRWIGDTVRLSAQLGIGQFLDLGAGRPGEDIPGVEDVHDTARRVIPDASVAYVDNDPAVCKDAAAVTGGDPGIAVTCADLADAGAVLGDGDVRRVIGLRQPLGVIFGLVLHRFPPEQAGEIVAGYVRELAPGSSIAVTVPAFGSAGLAERVSQACGVRVWDHPVRTVAGWLAGLEPAGCPPGPIAYTRPSWKISRARAPEVPYVTGGMAVKRLRLPCVRAPGRPVSRPRVRADSPAAGRAVSGHVRDRPQARRGAVPLAGDTAARGPERPQPVLDVHQVLHPGQLPAELGERHLQPGPVAFQGPRP